MNEPLPIKPSDFQPSDWISYLFFVFIFSLVVRAILSAFKAWMLEDLPDSKKINVCPCENFWNVFVNKNIPVSEKEYFFPFLIGLFELTFYPYLMFIQRWDAIAAWVTLKTVSQFKRWGEERNLFQRFLLGNILVLVFSFFILSPFFVK